MTKPVLLLLSGSLRKESFNRKLIHHAAKTFGPAEVVEGDLDLPLFNEDVEAIGNPDKVETLFEQVKRADALIIGAPEYNKGVSGPLKNGIDWLSRPQPSILKDKIAVVMSAAGGRTGGETAHFMTVSILTQLQVNVVHGPLILVAQAKNEFDESGALTNDFLAKQVAARMERLRGMLS
ncbi:NAD(P)H-dependent oxidoreductase [Roseovarius sp. SCSIO 43702]|uniref:NADPH-dependent FMN reductase n=1 Tax=Roseovarius sp. SCSIO 43702 TaxID=2823043 RepID=UPI001C736092|nr:NADPH-dependent FMN reductase [Roseovarius sp. SCSIO 43702]QYX56923.1 NAD(P)H-dependent oxidoreductase [Roseovarius sp. SCSIO 43702]